MVKDVVCGMNVSEQHAADKGLVVEHLGKTYHFCSKPCKKQFSKNPEAFLGSQPIAKKQQA